MTVNITAGDAQGSRNDETVYQHIPTSAARVIIRALSAGLDECEGTFFLADDEDTYDFYGETGWDMNPSAIERVLLDGTLSAEEKTAVDQIGIALIRKVVGLGQLVRINVGNGREQHAATISVDGTCVDEPAMNVCYSNAQHAFAAFGQRLPKVTDLFTYKASEILERENSAADGDRYLTGLLDIARYAVRRFGPNATLRVC
ncbi:hypothetical protein [Bosea massiliensis]|uniref:Phage gp6-like head-tail connector protein n=1 Tax=Bosea massiliensis TaxID=151419 RepID=A0ABW0P2R8_9HYPH